MLHDWTLEAPTSTADGKHADAVAVAEVDPAGIAGVVLRH